MSEHPRPNPFVPQPARQPAGLGARRADFGEPAQFLAFESELGARIQDLLNAGAVDDGTAHVLDRAIEQERLRAQAALLGERDRRLAELRTLAGERDGEVARLTWIRAEQEARLARLEKQLDQDSADFEGARRPDPGGSDTSRHAWHDEMRELKRSAKRRTRAARLEEKAARREWRAERRRLEIERERKRLQPPGQPPPDTPGES